MKRRSSSGCEYLPSDSGVRPMETTLIDGEEISEGQIHFKKLYVLSCQIKAYVGRTSFTCTEKEMRSFIAQVIPRVFFYTLADYPGE